MVTVLNNANHHVNLYALAIAVVHVQTDVVPVTAKQDVIQVVIISVAMSAARDVLLDAEVSVEIVVANAIVTAHLPQLMLVHAQQTALAVVKQDVVQVAIIRVNRNVFLDAVLDVRDVATRAQMDA